MHLPSVTVKGQALCPAVAAGAVIVDMVNAQTMGGVLVVSVGAAANTARLR